jgi:hypothetical protein
MAFHSSGESLSFGYTDHVNDVPRLEYPYIYRLAYLGIAKIIHPELSQMPEWSDSLEMACLGLVELFRIFIANLYSLVAVPLPSLDLCYHARPSLHYAYRLYYAVL